MTDPISVLLIIGAAVVGPSDAKVLNDRVPPGQHLCIDQTNNPGLTVLPSVTCLPAVYESLLQLCERAMREIGAFPTDPRHPYDFSLLNGGMISPVRCIPTPSGYWR